VAGDISGGNPINLNAGSLELGGSLNGRIINYNGGGSLIMNPGLDFSSVFAQLDAASSTLSSYQANSMASIPSGQPGPYVITANPDSDGRAVLLLDGLSLFGNHMVQQIDLAVNGASEILINVSGTSVDWLSGNFVGAFTNTEQRRNIVWNFYEATSVNFGARNMMGQVLAPLAHVTSQGNIDGSIYAKSLSTTGEVHLPGYGGSFTNTVPEPGAMMLCALGAMLLGVRRR
jgi:choice-of-anchor A domain-containing protein